MENKHSKNNKFIEKFIANHPKEFSIEIAEFISDTCLGLKPIAMVFLALNLASIISYQKTGAIELLFGHAATCLILLAITFIRFVDRIKLRYTHLIWHVFLLAWVMEIALILYLYKRNDMIESLSSSIVTVTTMALFFLNFHASKKWLYFYAVIFFFLLHTSVFYVDRDFYLFNIKSLIFGPMTGILCNEIVMKMFKYRFYVNHYFIDLKNHGFNEMSKILYPHQIKRIHDGSSLEDTMPTELSTGIVISFDIVGSSKIETPHLKDFLEAAIHDCTDLLSTDYDSESMTSKGYRIKEMGDGFLCSIGYPFPLRAGQNRADIAFNLAMDFIANLEQNLLNFGFQTPVYCGMGIAVGRLHGYYPKSGTKEYDLFGRGIVLATRYEAMRKALFPFTDSHCIIIQKEVVEEMSEAIRHSLQKVKLTKTMRIRDHEEARELYYLLVPSILDNLRKAG